MFAANAGSGRIAYMRGDKAKADFVYKQMRLTHCADRGGVLLDWVMFCRESGPFSSKAVSLIRLRKGNRLWRSPKSAISVRNDTLFGYDRGGQALSIKKK